MKKYLVLTFALLLVLTVLFSCKGNDAVTDITTGSDATTDSVQSGTPSELTMKIENGQFNFKVIRSDVLTESSAEVKTAQTITSKLSATFGTRVLIATDFLKSGSSHDDSSFEILVGVTNYSQSEKWAKECGYGDYIIQVEGNKIVIVAYSEQCLQTAASVFLSKVTNAYDESSGEATLVSSELVTQKTVDTQLSDLPIFDGGNFFSYYDAGNRLNSSKTQCDGVIIKNTTADEFNAYLSKLGTSGFEKKAENTMDGSLFATYANDKYVISAGYYKPEKSVRLFIEQSYDVSAFTETKSYNKVTSSMITLMGVEYPDASHVEGYIPNGMSILIRLEDGRFVIVDGGFNRNDPAYALIREMQEQSKDYTDKPTVAAWIITHAHGDHDGVFASHNEKFKSAGIKIETVIANVMSELERKKALNSTSQHFTGQEGQRGAGLLTAAEKTGAAVYKAHVGQKYRFANLELDVLYTLESYAPNVCNALNTTSIVTKMTFSDSASDKKTTFLCTGDATGAAMETLNRTFGSYIQSDILQIAHHGGNTADNDNGTASAYKSANASLILWPLGLHSYHTYISKSFNQVVFSRPNYVECYFAGSQGDTVKVPLPYIAGETKVDVKCGGNCPVSHSYNENAGIS